MNISEQLHCTNSVKFISGALQTNGTKLNSGRMMKWLALKCSFHTVFSSHVSYKVIFLWMQYILWSKLLLFFKKELFNVPYNGTERLDITLSGLYLSLTVVMREAICSFFLLKKYLMDFRQIIINHFKKHTAFMNNCTCKVLFLHINYFFDV